MWKKTEDKSLCLCFQRKWFYNFSAILLLISIWTLNLYLPENFLRIFITARFWNIKATLPLNKEREEKYFLPVFSVCSDTLCKVDECIEEVVYHSLIIWCEILILIRPQVVTNFDVTGDNLVRKIRKIEKWEHILEIVYRSHNWMTHTFISLNLEL